MIDRDGNEVTERDAWTPPQPRRSDSLIKCDDPYCPNYPTTHTLADDRKATR